MINEIKSNFKPKKGCDASSGLRSAQQIALSDVTTAFFSIGSCVLVLDPAGASACELVTLLEGRLTHTHPPEQTARLSCGVDPTRPKPAHRILQEWLAQLAPNTNTNGHTYQGLLQIIGRRLGTNNSHTYHGLILEVPLGLAETDTGELATVLSDLKIIQRTHQGLSILVTASPRQHLTLPREDQFTAIVTIPEPSPEELKPVVRSIVPAASEELAALIVAYACKLHTYNLAPTASHINTVTELANIVITNNTDATTAFHALIGRSISAKLASITTKGSGKKSVISLPGIVAATVAAHAGIVDDNDEDNGHSSEDDTVWIPIQSIYHQYLTLAQTQTYTQAGPVRGISYQALTANAIPLLNTAGIVVTHPSGKHVVALNPILTDTHIIPSILNPPEQLVTTHDDGRSTTPQLSHRQQNQTPEQVSHIALLAALVKTEQNTHPAIFPTHRSIYATYQKICAKLNTSPKPLAKIYRSVQSLKKTGVIHVHRAHNKQGRPNQLLHNLSPNDIAQLRAKTYAIRYPKYINKTDLQAINSHLNFIIESMRSNKKRDVLNIIATIAAHTNKNLFNASNAYDIYAKSTPNPIPKHSFLATIRKIIKDNILSPLYRSADLALNLTLNIPTELPAIEKPPP